jgi:hypothetical protein
MTQLEFAASVPLTTPPATGQVVTTPVSSTNGPPKRAEVMDKAMDWLFVSVNVLAVLVAPTAIEPNPALDGPSVTCAIPVPDSDAVCVP